MQHQLVSRGPWHWTVCNFITQMSFTENDSESPIGSYRGIRVVERCLVFFTYSSHLSYASYAKTSGTPTPATREKIGSRLARGARMLPAPLDAGCDAADQPALKLPRVSRKPAKRSTNTPATKAPTHHTLSALPQAGCATDQPVLKRSSSHCESLPIMIWNDYICGRARCPCRLQNFLVYEWKRASNRVHPDRQP